MEPNKIKVCILNIATNKYIRLLSDVQESIKKYFLAQIDRECEINFLVFTNHEIESKPNIKISKIDHEPWPMPTLKRFSYFLKEKDFILKHDYCFYFDVDLKVVRPIGMEVLGDLVAVVHPSYFDKKPDEFSYDRNPKSSAYIPFGKGLNYFYGAFNGGRTGTFMKMASELERNTREDLKKGIIALWHDESHLNRYLVDNPSTTILPYPYLIAENQDRNNLESEPTIIALDKYHNEIRGIKTPLLKKLFRLTIKTLSPIKKKIFGEKKNIMI